MSLPNLFSHSENPKDEIRLFIYADEIKVVKNYLSDKWFYIGLLLIPESKKNKLLEKLKSAREETNYNSELHFCKLGNYSYSNHYNEKTLLAKKWMEIILDDATEKMIYFNILGICASNLNWSFFGERRKQFKNAYNRFFRTLLLSSLNYFFPNKNITIVELFHDKEIGLQLHDYFDWHTIYKLSNELENVYFESSSINFIDSNHEKESVYKDDSNFIQLIDLILGGFRQSFDKTSSKDGCIEIAKLFSPLLQKIIESPYNKNSSHGYYRKYNFSFFPPLKLNPLELLDDYNRLKSKFFQKRPLPFINEGQLELF